MKDSRVFIYRIDAENSVVDVNDEWLEFARENNSSDLTRSSIQGKNLLQFISDPETAGIFSELIQIAREKDRVITVQFHCDSPALVRYMEMTITPLPAGHIEFRNRMIKCEERPPVNLIDVTIPRSNNILKVCSWCKKGHANHGWDSLENIVQLDGYFDSATPPRISHGICPTCEAEMFKTIKNCKGN